MNATIYKQDGSKAGDIALPESIFGAKWNADLVHQVVTSMLANKRTSTAHVKDRSEVAGGGRKPWKQKGTGRSRHGSTRSPIWRHGGVAHGPSNEKDYSKKINQRMRVQALFSALSQKLRDGELVFVDTLAFGTPKAKDAKGVLKALGTVKGLEQISSRRKNAAYIGLGVASPEAAKSFSNFGNVTIESVRDINPVDVVSHKYLVITNPTETLAFLASKIK